MGRPDADTLIRYSNVAAVSAVAVFAAVISYSHIYGLGREHGYPGYAAALLPLTVDGLILAASVVLLRAVRAKIQAPWIAHATLWLGVLVTVLANVTYGLAYGPVAAVISAWPALAFVLTVETVRAQVAVSAVSGKSWRTRSRRTRTPVIESVPPLTSGPRTVLESSRLPSVRAVMREAKCGQAVATDLIKIMREDAVDLPQAQMMRAGANATRK